MKKDDKKDNDKIDETTLPKETREMEAAAAEKAYSDSTAAPEPTLEEQILLFKDKWLRSEAEIQNLRKRTEQEKNDLRLYALSQFARDVLDIRDSIVMALAHSPKTEDLKDEAFKNLLQGFQMIEKNILNLLEQYNIRPIKALGNVFDPSVHEAVVEVETTEAEPRTVVEVLQDGFTINQRLLRAARVSIARPPEGASLGNLADRDPKA